MHHARRSGLVWLVSAAALLSYGALGLIGVRVPGVEELVSLLSQAEGWQFMVAGFVAIMLEGLYVVGNFFPGTTTVMLVAVLSGVGSWWQFAGTILAIFVGWCVAGAINIAFAYRSFRAGRPLPEHVFLVRDNVWLSWFPAFRANYEVSQIAAGGRLTEVIISALRVRALASVGAAGLAALIASIVDLHQLDNEEGFLTLFLVATIMTIIGYRDLRQGRHTPDHERTD